MTFSSMARLFVQKLGWIGVVGRDTADLRSGKKHGLRFLAVEPGFDTLLVAQIELIPANGQKLAILGRQPTNDSRAHHAAVTGNENALFAELKRHRCYLACAEFSMDGYSWTCCASSHF